MASLHGQWNLFYDMTNRKSVSGKILHIQQRDNGTSLCGRDDNYGLPISFPVSAPICGKCLEIKANDQAETIAYLQAEIESLKAVIQDSKAYEVMLVDGSDERGCDVCNGKGQLICWRCDGKGIEFGGLCPECDGNLSFECQDCEGTGDEHHASVETETENKGETS